MIVDLENCKFIGEEVGFIIFLTFEHPHVKLEAGNVYSFVDQILL